MVSKLVLTVRFSIVKVKGTSKGTAIAADRTFKIILFIIQLLFNSSSYALSGVVSNQVKELNYLQNSLPRHVN